MSGGALVPAGSPGLLYRLVDGLLVAPGDVAALTDSLARLMRDEALRRRLAQEATAVADRYAPERILALWRSEIEAVCAATPAVPTT